MRLICQLLSWVCLAATMLPSLAYLAGRIDLETTKWMMLAATIGWFVFTPFWMGRPGDDASSRSAT